MNKDIEQFFVWGVVAVFAVLGSVVSGVLADSATVEGAARIDFENPTKEGGQNTVDVVTTDVDTGVQLDGVLEVTFANSNTRVVSGDLGHILWKSDGTAITGKIVGPAGQDVAELTGVLEDGGMSGQFKDAVGRVGSWKWTGEVPARE